MTGGSWPNLVMFSSWSADELDGRAMPGTTGGLGLCELHLSNMPDDGRTGHKFSLGIYGITASTDVVSGVPHHRPRLYLVCVRADIAAAVGEEATSELLRTLCKLLEHLLVHWRLDSSESKHCAHLCRSDISCWRSCAHRL